MLLFSTQTLAALTINSRYYRDKQGRPIHYAYCTHHYQYRTASSSPAGLQSAFQRVKDEDDVGAPILANHKDGLKRGLESRTSSGEVSGNTQVIDRCIQSIRPSELKPYLLVIDGGAVERRGAIVPPEAPLDPLSPEVIIKDLREGEFIVLDLSPGVACEARHVAMHNFY